MPGEQRDENRDQSGDARFTRSPASDDPKLPHQFGWRQPTAGYRRKQLLLLDRERQSEGGAKNRQPHQPSIDIVTERGSKQALVCEGAIDGK